MTTRNDITGDPIKTKGRLSEEGRDNWDRIFGNKELKYEVKDTVVEFSDPAESVERKLKEWNMMYDCLKNMSNYEYPLEEVRDLLKRIKV